MSKKFPMVSLDKVEIKLTMKTTCVVAVDRIAAMSGLSRAAIINGYVEDGLAEANVQLTADDYRKIEEIRAQNAAKREALKIKKGGN